MTAFPSSENPLYDLELEAGADAFGDGSHPSTNSALQVMQGLSQHVTFERILDMGSGAGLLAMASALFWPDANVLGADIQESAVALAQKNSARNGLESRIRFVQSRGYAHTNVKASAPYDLILCNMTADLVLELAEPLAKHLATGGLAILSGVLAWREREVQAAHEAYGLVPYLPPLRAGEWSVMTFTKPA